MITIGTIQVSETSPTEPISLNEAKAWLQIDFSDHDDLLTGMITGAREDIEQELGVKLVDASVIVYTDTTNNVTFSQLPQVLNFGSINNLVVNGLADGEADQILVLNDDYYFNGSLKLGTGSFKLEYDVVPVVPTTIKEAIKMLVAYRYNNRGDQEKQMGIPEDVLKKIERLKQIWL